MNKMKIGLEINEVIRAFNYQLEYVFNKYIGVTEETQVDIEKNPVLSLDLIKYFPFPKEDDLLKFLYRDASLEIFGHADMLYENINTHLNNFVMDMRDFYDADVYIIGKEGMSAIPSTLFFLSKLACKVENIKFVTKYEDMWGDMDIFITANPNTLKLKPEGKTTIKINTTYNADSEADYTFDTVTEFFTNMELQNELLNK